MAGYYLQYAFKKFCAAIFRAATFEHTIETGKK
jgi:hypothetical protein